MHVVGTYGGSHWKDMCALESSQQLGNDNLVVSLLGPQIRVRPQWLHMLEEDPLL